MVCNCKKSNCKTNQCGCRKSSKVCDEKCGCLNCENFTLIKSEHDSNSSESETEQYVDVMELASNITEKVRIPVTKKKDAVFEFRNNKDIYTDKERKYVENPQVDHIVEDQILGHASACVLKNQRCQPYLEGLKLALNPDTLENYNVTFGSVNQSKGSIIKSYLTDGRNQGFTLRALVIDKYNQRPFGKNMEPIFEAMNDTYPIVAEYVRESRRSDGHVTGSNNFERISDELIEIFMAMDLDVNTGRKTRSSKK